MLGALGVTVSYLRGVGGLQVLTAGESSGGLPGASGGPSLRPLLFPLGLSAPTHQLSLPLSQL